VKGFKVLVSKVVEGEIFIAAETADEAKEIALDLASNDVNEGEVLTDAADALVDNVEEASDEEKKNFNFVDAAGNDVDLV
jgi:hypothetical protein